MTNTSIKHETVVLGVNLKWVSVFSLICAHLSIVSCFYADMTHTITLIVTPYLNIRVCFGRFIGSPYHLVLFKKHHFVNGRVRGWARWCKRWRHREILLFVSFLKRIKRSNSVHRWSDTRDFRSESWWENINVTSRVHQWLYRIPSSDPRKREMQTSPQTPQTDPWWLSLRRAT